MLIYNFGAGAYFKCVLPGLFLALMAEERQRTDNPGFSRLLELLHGSYLRKGVRNSVASKLEQV